MDSAQFLGAVWPDSGPYCLATPSPNGNGFRHQTFASIGAAASAATSLDGAGNDAYFALATLHENRVWDSRKFEGKGGWTYRTKSNMNALQTFYLEVDVVRPDEASSLSEDALASKYTDRREAIQGLKSFCDWLEWPRPMVVSSGWGFHCYWLLDRPIRAEQYEPIAQRMMAVARKAGFKLDRAAMDISRVLRVVGTHNYKADPKPVEVIAEVLTRHNPMDLAKRLAAAIEKHQIEVTARPRMADVPAHLRGMGSNLVDEDDRPLELDLLRRCGALDEFVSKHGHVDYHHWLHGIQVFRYLENGRAEVHRLSSGSDKYVAADVDKMLDNLEEKGIGPALCSSFSEDTDACKTCPWNGKIKSPIVLGRRKEQLINRDNAPEEPIQLERVEPMPGKVFHIPPAPEPFKRVPGKGIFIESSDPNGDVTDVQIFANDMMPAGRKYHEREGREYTYWRTGNPADGTVTLEIPAAALYDSRAFTKVMGDAGVYVMPKSIDHMRSYMVAYIQELQKHTRRENLHSRLGWRENNTVFVLGERSYSKTGSEQCEIERTNRAADGIRAVGSFEEWKRIVSMYESDEFIPHQFAFATAFGAPLMPFTGQSGGIINLLGRSGEGKSTVQKLVNSVWGHPEDLMLPAEASSSTHNAKIGYIHLLNNLPVCAEEITNVEAREVQSLAYAINTGEEKLRMNRDGSMKPARGGWNTIMLSSSNSSLHDKLIGTEGAAATTLRVMEIRMPLVRKYNKTEFFQAFDIPLKSNYGRAGHVYAEFLAKNHEKLQDLVMKVMADLDYKSRAVNEERVWLALIAANIAGLLIAKRCGLHNFNIEQVEQYAISQMRSMRHQTEDLRVGAAEALAMFVDDSMRKTLTVKEAQTGGSTTTMMLTRPFDGLAIRHELHSNRMFISNSAFRHWCKDQGFIFNDITKELHESGVVTKRNINKTLGAGTEYSGGQVRCFAVNTVSPQFTGGAALRVVTDSQSNLDQPANA